MIPKIQESRKIQENVSEHVFMLSRKISADLTTYSNTKLKSQNKFKHF